MLEKIAIFNQKGGVAKSTTAVNLAAGLVKFYNKRVLIVDTDPQGHAGAGLGIPVWELQAQIMHVFTGQIQASDAIVSTTHNVDILPSNVLLTDIEIPISGRAGRERILRKALAPVENNYDVIIFDCPPNAGLFSVNALMASNKVIAPVDMSFYGLLAISQIERTLQLIREELEHPIELAGVLATKFDGRNNISKSVLEKLENNFGSQLFKTTIPESVKLREAPSYGQSIFDYDPKGAGAIAYRALIDEVMSAMEVKAA